MKVSAVRLNANAEEIVKTSPRLRRRNERPVRGVRLSHHRLWKLVRRALDVADADMPSVDFDEIGTPRGVFGGSTMNAEKRAIPMERRRGSDPADEDYTYMRAPGDFPVRSGPDVPQRLTPKEYEEAFYKEAYRDGWQAALNQLRPRSEHCEKLRAIAALCGERAGEYDVPMLAAALFLDGLADALEVRAVGSVRYTKRGGRE